MNYLNHALSLYRESERIKRLKIEHILSDDKREKQALRIAIINLQQENKG